MKDVCTSCRKAFSQGHNDTNRYEDGRICPDCGQSMFHVSNKFKPPKKTDAKSWEIVRYLIESGYSFYSAYDNQGLHISYPTTIEDAEEFVNKQKEIEIERYRKTNTRK